MAESSFGRRQFRLSITSEMGDVWSRLKDVRPRSSTRELEWLLRLGVLAESGLRAGGPAVGALLARLAATQSEPGLGSVLGGGQPQPITGALEGPAADPPPRSRATGWDVGPFLESPQ